MVESARKHGPFYDRYPVRLKVPAPSWELRPDGDGGERLEWSAFLARFFPNRRRHDLAALAAYGVYRNTLEQGTPQQRPTTYPSSSGSPRWWISRPSGGRDGEQAPAGRNLVSGGADLGIGGWQVGTATGRLMGTELGFRRGFLSRPTGSPSAVAGESSEAEGVPQSRAAAPANRRRPA